MWICDSCGEIIKQPEDGWVEWITEDDNKSHGLRLVHHKPKSPLSRQYGCQYDSRNNKYMVSDSPLTLYLGNNGLMILLSLFYSYSLPTDEIIEMIKRLHINDYEMARRYFPEAISLGIVEPNLPEGFYHDYQIKDVIDALEKGELER